MSIFPHKQSDKKHGDNSYHEPFQDFAYIGCALLAHCYPWHMVFGPAAYECRVRLVGYHIPSPRRQPLDGECALRGFLGDDIGWCERAGVAVGDIKVFEREHYGVGRQSCGYDRIDADGVVRQQLGVFVDDVPDAPAGAPCGVTRREAEQRHQ